MGRSTDLHDLLHAALRDQTSRRALLRRAALAGLALPAAGEWLSGSGLPTAWAAAAKGGTATVPASASPTSWDLTKADWITWGAVNYLYDRFLDADRSENIKPMLATSMTVSKDVKTYTLKLRSGVKFHDGTPFNAAAAKYNLERHTLNKDSRYYSVWGTMVDHIETPDDSTVVVVLNQPNADMPYNFADWGALQVSPTVMKTLGKDYASHPVGTGPFKFGSYVPDSHIQYTANAQYWQKAPLLDGLLVNILPDPNVQMDNLQAKTLDFIGNIDPKDVATVKKLGAVLEAGTVPGVSFVSMNLTQPPTSELAVRKAIARSIDRDAMIQKIMYNFAVKSRAGASPGSHYYNADVPMVDYSPSDAAKILDEAGWQKGPDGIRQKNGTKLSLSLLSANLGNQPLINQVIQEQLKVVGIDSKITSLEWGTYLDTWRENKGGWNITFGSQGSTYASTALMECSWYPTAFWNICQLGKSTDPQVQKVAAQLNQIFNDQLATADQNKRRALAKQAQTLYQDNQFTVWLWHGQNLTALQQYLKGYDMEWHGRIVGLSQAWLNK
jgi:peptide/nickel transport system substrate-binding protein